MKRKIVLGSIILACVTFFTFGVYADNLLTEITASIDTAMKIKYNGNEFKLANADGSALYPILYNGRTYVPLRSIGGMFGVAVDYDSSANTVILGEREGDGVKISQLKSKIGNGGFNYTEDDSLLTVDGVTFKSGYYLKNPYGGSGYEGFGEPFGTLEYDLSKSNSGTQFQTMRFRIGTDINEKIHFIIQDMDSRAVLKDNAISKDSGIQEYTVKLAGTTHFKIDFSNASSLGADGIVIEDPVLK